MPSYFDDIKPINTIYHNVYEISPLQQVIMKVIDKWCHKRKTPISRFEILIETQKQGYKSLAVVNALNGLIKLHYIRKAIVFDNKLMHPNKSKNNKRGEGLSVFYVQLRRI